MIERIELRDFKSHVDTVVDFGRLTLLVGPNSSGKSSVLEAIEIICQRHDFLEGHHAGDLVRNGRTHFSIHLHVSDPKSRAKLPRPFLVLSWNKDGNLIDPRKAGNQRIKRGLTKFLEATHLKLNPQDLAAPSYSKDIPPRMNRFGAGLSPVIANLRAAEPERFQSLMILVKSVLPFVNDIRVKPAKVLVATQTRISIDDRTVPLDRSEERIGHEIVLDVEGARDLPARVISDGTMLTIGLLTFLVSSSSPNVILVDDIEQGLHPKAQRELVGVLKRLLDERPELQIVATTHSPYVVDELDASDVWVLAANQDGETKARRLSDHPDAKKALEVLTTGEFLSAEGEDWVLEASPADA